MKSEVKDLLVNYRVVMLFVLMGIAMIAGVFLGVGIMGIYFGSKAVWFLFGTVVVIMATCISDLGIFLYNGMFTITKRLDDA